MKTDNRTPGRRVIVVGGGAAGMMAAGQAALAGAEVHLLEKMDQPGRKVAITGKGRCNLTNIAPLEEFIKAYGPNGKFLRQAFNRFFNAELIEFMRGLGVLLILERNGRYFPQDNRAETITAALANWLDSLNVDVQVTSPVKDILVTNRECIGVTTVRGVQLVSDAVIIATGGLSYPETGSSGDGYVMASALGHTVVPTRPSLVPLTVAGEIGMKLQGLSLRDVGLRLFAGDRCVADLVGDVLFAHFGLSGPAILQISRFAVDALRQKKPVEVSLDLLPAFDERALEDRLLVEAGEHGKKAIRNLLAPLLPSSLIPVALELLNISPDLQAGQLTADERRRLRHWLKDFRMVITGHRSFKEAIVTAGGVSLSEIDPRTMESKLIRNLYFAGEVLDIDGQTGGYNLQAAFSTGWLAGRLAAGDTGRP